MSGSAFLPSEVEDDSLKCPGEACCWNAEYFTMKHCSDIVYVLTARSEIRVPTAGTLHIYSPGSTEYGTVCERDCMHVGAFDVPHSHKLTTPMLLGGSLLHL